MGPIGESCGDCRFWNKLGGAKELSDTTVIGHCLFNPPVLGFQELEKYSEKSQGKGNRNVHEYWSTCYPVTADWCWCGKFEPHEDE